MNKTVKVLVTTPRGSPMMFFSLKSCAEFFTGKLWCHRNKNWYTYGSVMNLLAKREDRIDGYKFQYKKW